MIGDHAQLKPLIKNDEVRYDGRFARSLFERLQRLGENRVPAVVLNVQGRARPEICNIYRDRYSTLKDMPGVPFSVTLRGYKPAEWINIEAGQQAAEENREESKAICATIKTLIDSRLITPQQISVLTPYNKQKELVSRQIENRNIQIRTVDEFQGLENDVIFISLVSHRPSPWLCEKNRITVLLSRARCHLIIFGNRKGFASVDAWRDVVNRIPVRSVS